MRFPSKREWRLIGLGIVAILIAVVILQNTEYVETRVLFFRLGMPRAVLLFLAVAVGFVLGWLGRARAARKRS